MTQRAAHPWRRLNAALMPDYNRRAAVFWWATVMAGAMGLAWALVSLRDLTVQGWAQIVGAALLAMLAGLFPMRVPGSRNSFVAGEVFIFLLLLMQGPAAAAVAAAAEAFVGSFRTSRRWTSRLVSPAVATLNMGLTGSVLQAGQQAAARGGFDGVAMQMAAMTIFAAVYFLFGAITIAGVQRLKRGEPFLQLVQTVSVFRWVGIAYAGSAAVSTLLFATLQSQGAGVLVVMAPLLVMLLVTLHFYFQQQEAAEAMRSAAADARRREAEMAAREAESAERHLRELQASERRFEAAFRHASIGMALMAFDGRILQVNAALGELLGRREPELVDHSFLEFVHEADLPQLKTKLGLADDHEFDGFATELRCVAGDGSPVWAALHCSFFTEPHDETPCLILQAQDVTARRRAEESLAHLAFHDPLTGLPNRRRFTECLSGALSRNQGNRGVPFALMFIDFDRFKIVNDSLGHSAGDDMLVQLTRRIQENLRPHDIVARLGGDEFAVLVDQLHHERDAVVLAERLMAALAQPLHLGPVEVVVSASIGITFSSMGYSQPEAMLRDADIAMYKAKGMGKACYALFDAGLHRAVAQRLRLEGELRQAVAQNQLVVEYQPLVQLDSGRLVGFEALVRWHHPHDGPLAPASFLGIAEESGLMIPLSDFVLQRACRQLRQWQCLDPQLAQLTMSVNVSARDLAQPGLVGRVGRALAEAGLAPEHLTLELTENILMTDIAGGEAVLGELRRQGVRLSVDDFGTGYSSLSHLARLPIDTLKIDRSFVGQLQPGSDMAAVVRAIVQLGSLLRMSVIAEGVESQAQMEQLRDMGCHLGQGFHLGTPQSAQAAGALLEQVRATLH